MMPPAELREWQLLGVLDVRGAPGAWAADGLCAQTDPDAFFPDETQAALGNQARRVCRPCRVRLECLTYALVAGELFGVWGGEGFNSRKRMPRPTPASYRADRAARAAQVRRAA